MYENEIGSTPGHMTSQTRRDRSTSRYDQITNSLGLGDTEDAARQLLGKAKDNPLPVALIGAGVAWLLWPKSSRGKDMGTSASTHDSVETVKATMNSAGASVIDSAKGVYQNVASSVSEVGDALGSKTQSASHHARNTYTNTRTQLGETIEAQPVVAALGALFAGVIAGVIPKPSQLENRFVGDYSDRMKDGIRSEAENAVALGKDVLNETVSNAVDELEESGLTFQGIREKVEDVATNVKTDAVAKAKAGLEKTAESIGEEVAATKRDLKGDSRS